MVSVELREYEKTLDTQLLLNAGNEEPTSDPSVLLQKVEQKIYFEWLLYSFAFASIPLFILCISLYLTPLLLCGIGNNQLEIFPCECIVIGALPIRSNLLQSYTSIEYPP